QEIGNDAFLKSTASFGTGLLGGKLAMNGTVVRKTGDGIIDGTWTDAWAYYFGASYNLNKNNRLEAYAIGAPQRHGQNLFRQNIAVYDAEFAKDLKDYDQEALTIYNQAGLKFNQNVAPVTNYNAQQAVEDKLVDRHDASFLNERENFYHKPQVNLNWYSKLTESLNLFSVAYYSGGYGGGTGTQGSLLRQNFFDDGGNPFGELPWSWDWDATIARNQANADGSRGILRNSRNNQYTYGLISKAEYKANDNVKYVVGVDWRTAEIEHYREVRDLLGGEYYRDFTQNDFWSDEDRKRGLGDRIAYDFTNTVDWVGGFGQVEYSKDKVSAYGMFGYSGIKYGHENFFLANEQDENGDPIVSSGPLTRETDWIAGYQAKGGANFRINEDMNVFFNVGYVSKVPIFDEVINDVDGTERGDFNNEHFTSYEMGWAFSDPEGLLAMNISGYYTQWSNRANRRNLTFREADGTELDVLVFLDGIDALHSGIEMEAALKPHKMLRFDGMVSWALWKHTSDAGGEFRLYGEDSDVLNTGTLNFALKDLRVGDAPQFQTALTMTVTPMRGLNLQATGRYYGRHYAGWNPFDRVYQPGTDDLVDRTQSWQAPNYGVLDLHGYYTLPIDVAGLKFRLFGHVFNALDGLYIQDATDNSAFNAWDRDHDADDAEVYFGLPRTFNFGLQINL
nr:TonB-dependent receptor [Calditrichia bacterium]